MIRLIFKIFNVVSNIIYPKISYFYWKGNGVKLGKNSKIMKKTIIHSPSKLEIGKNSIIGEFINIWAGGEIKIGDNVLIATHSLLISETHDKNAEIYSNSSIKKTIVIEDNVWIGANVIILPGIKIGKNSIIGAGSVVTKNIPENEIWAGNPAKLIQKKENK